MYLFVIFIATIAIGLNLESVIWFSSDYYSFGSCDYIVAVRMYTSYT